jgi:hypothetical protein
MLARNGENGKLGFAPLRMGFKPSKRERHSRFPKSSKHVCLQICHLGSFVERIGNQAWKVLIVSVDILIVCNAERLLSHLRKN